MGAFCRVRISTYGTWNSVVKSALICKAEVTSFKSDQKVPDWYSLYQLSEYLSWRFSKKYWLRQWSHQRCVEVVVEVLILRDVFTTLVHDCTYIYIYTCYPTVANEVDTL